MYSGYWHTNYRAPVLHTGISPSLSHISLYAAFDTKNVSHSIIFQTHKDFQLGFRNNSTQVRQTDIHYNIISKKKVQAIGTKPIDSISIHDMVFCTLLVQPPVSSPSQNTQSHLRCTKQAHAAHILVNVSHFEISRLHFPTWLLGSRLTSFSRFPTRSAAVTRSYIPCRFSTFSRLRLVCSFLGFPLCHFLCLSSSLFSLLCLQLCLCLHSSSLLAFSPSSALSLR